MTRFHHPPHPPAPPVLIETLRRPAGKQPTDKAQTFASRLLIQRMALFSVKPWETQKKQQVTSSDEMGALTAHWNRNVPPQLAEKFDPIWTWKKKIQRPVTSFMWSPALRNQRSYQRADTCRAKELSLGWSRGPQVASMGAGRPRISRDRSPTKSTCGSLNCRIPQFIAPFIARIIMINPRTSAQTLVPSTSTHRPVKARRHTASP